MSSGEAARSRKSSRFAQATALWPPISGKRRNRQPRSSFWETAIGTASRRTVLSEGGRATNAMRSVPTVHMAASEHDAPAPNAGDQPRRPIPRRPATPLNHAAQALKTTGRCVEIVAAVDGIVPHTHNDKTRRGDLACPNGAPSLRGGLSRSHRPGSPRTGRIGLAWGPKPLPQAWLPTHASRRPCVGR
jgi:hypothetical protein